MGRGSRPKESRLTNVICRSYSREHLFIQVQVWLEDGTNGNEVCRCGQSSYIKQMATAHLLAFLLPRLLSCSPAHTHACLDFVIPVMPFPIALPQ
jgi:hypothetical protein